MRSSFNSPAIQVNTMASKEMIKEFYHGYDGVLKLFKPDFESLISGVKYWCEHLQQSVVVFGAFHGFEGDLPSRCQAGGFKKPSGHTHSDCHCCPGTKGKLAEQVQTGVMPSLREAEAVSLQVEQVNSTQVPIFREALSYQFGITRRSAMWDYPGAQLSTQLLAELMHCEAEGELPKHFLLLVPQFQKADPQFFVKLDARTRSYFTKLRVSFPSISTLEKWRWHTNAADRLRFCLHSVYLLAPFAIESLKEDFALWKIHVRFVQLLAQHHITAGDVAVTQDLPLVIQRGMVKFYGTDHLTINSHWTFHLFLFILWFSVLRLYWTFPQESLLHKMKNITKKMTNHKATSYSCLRLFVLDRHLNLLLKPMEHIPIKFDLKLGPEVAISALAEALESHGLQKTPQDRMSQGCVVTKEYQVYQEGTIVATTGGVREIKDILAVDHQIFYLFTTLNASGKTTVGLPKFTRSPDLFLDRENFLHRCLGVWEGDEFVLNFEEK